MTKGIGVSKRGEEDQFDMPTLTNDLNPAQCKWVFDSFNDDLTFEEFGFSDGLLPFERRCDVSPYDPYIPPGFPGMSSYQTHIQYPDNRSTIFRLGSCVEPNEKPRNFQMERPSLRDEFLPYSSKRPYPAPQPCGYPSLKLPSSSPKRIKKSVVGPEKEGKCPDYPHIGDKLSWQQSYENLMVYKEAYGDCDVPQKYKENTKLGGWVVSNDYL